VERARYAYEVARAGIAAETADAWFQAKGLAIQLADAQESVRITQGLYDVAEKRARVGIAAESEADRVAGDLAQAQSQVAALEAQLQVEKRAILILAGRIVEPTANINATPNVGAPPAIRAACPANCWSAAPTCARRRRRCAAR
jgi:outer membrane protein TolC